MEMPVPVVYNSSGYESVETLKMLDGLIDIYLPDFKYIRADKAQRYSKAADYPEIAKAALPKCAASSQGMFLTAK
jgi:putative pyruvate formate lyase activating enzyme